MYPMSQISPVLAKIKDYEISMYEIQLIILHLNLFYINI